MSADNFRLLAELYIIRVIFRIEVIFRVFTVLIILAATQISALAQTRESDSSFLAQAIRYRRVANQNMLADNARLYNGTDYKDVILHDYDIGHPYFITTKWQKGSIEYDGQKYENVDLLYDLVKDKVLTHQYYTLMKIDLIQENITSFTLDDHLFVRVSQGDSLGKFLQPGFYDSRVQGKACLYVKRKKEFSEDLTSGRIVLEFRESNSFFIIKDGKVFQIKTRKDLLTAFSERKNLIRDKLAESKIRFKNQTEPALILATKLYNASL